MAEFNLPNKIYLTPDDEIIIEDGNAKTKVGREDVQYELRLQPVENYTFLEYVNWDNEPLDEHHIVDIFLKSNNDLIIESGMYKLFDEFMKDLPDVDFTDMDTEAPEDPSLN